MRDLPLADHHCHGVIRRDVDRSGFEALLTEAGSAYGPRPAARPAPTASPAHDGGGHFRHACYLR